MAAFQQARFTKTLRAPRTPMLSLMLKLLASFAQAVADLAKGLCGSSIVSNEILSSRLEFNPWIDQSRSKADAIVLKFV